MVHSRIHKALVALGAAALLTITALPVVAQDGAPLLFVINKSADQQYFIDLQTALQGQDRGARCRRPKAFDAKLEPNLGVSLVNDAISAGAKGIAITVPDQTIGPAIAKAAKAAGVALVATDDSIDDAEGNPVPFVGFNGTDMGTKVGAEAARLLTEGGWLEDTAEVGVLSTEVQTLSVCKDRTDATKKAMLAAGVPAEPSSRSRTPARRSRRRMPPARSSRPTRTSPTGSSSPATTRASSARSTRSPPRA